jgi:c-mer proto-oncogene tyrosine kinase/anaplastic lymphoma kinase/receptor tyrosine kinase
MGICVGLCSHVTNTSVCSTELDDNLWNVMRYIVICYNIVLLLYTICSANGTCEPYIGSGSRACDSIFTPGETYVYILNNRLNGSQELLQKLMNQVNGIIALIPERCVDAGIQVLCRHFYLPCGFNGIVHVPIPSCPDLCKYFSETLCPTEWIEGNSFLKNFALPIYRNDPTLEFPNCDQTDEQIEYLNLSEDCCFSGGIVPASDNVTVTISPTSFTPSNDTQLVDVVIPVVVLLSLFIVMLLAGITIGFIFYMRKKKNNATDHSNNQGHGRSSRYAIWAVKSVNKNKALPIKEKEEIPLNHCEHFKEISPLLISSKKISLQEMIGQGEFGIVYRAVMTSDDGNVTPVAVKTLKGLFSEGDVDSIIKESVKMSTFDHRNVLSLTGVCLELGQAPCIIMPFMVNGSLLNYLKKERANLTITENNQDDEMTLANVQKQLMTICLQVAEGMTYLSLMKFVHRDLAARNCMIDSNGVIKVADFGLSEDVYLRNYFRQFKNKEKSQQVKLPVKWMAIESLHDGIFSEKSDVWSYGVLMWEVFSLGKSPYPGLDPVGVVQLLDKGNRLTPPNNAACSDEIYKLMLSCWEGDPNERPHFDDLLKSINDIIKPLADYTTLISNEL